MKATDFVRVLPELLAFIDSREAVLETQNIDNLITDPRHPDTAMGIGRIRELRHLRQQLQHIERTQREESEVCLGW